MAVWMNTQKQRRVQFPKRFTFTFTRVLGRLNCALALAEFLVVFSSSLCPSTFYLLLYLFYNSIRVLLCFSILYSRLFVCFSSASANYRIQLIYLLAILDPSFTRGARSSGCTVSISPWWIVDRLMDCVKRGSGPEVSPSSSTSGLRAWLSRHRNWVCALV